MAAGTFSSNSLGFGLVMFLEDRFTDVADKIRNGISGLNTAVDGAAANISASFGKIAAGTGMIATGLGLLSGLNKALQMRERTENFEMQMKTLLGSQEAAVAAIAAIRKQSMEAPLYDTQVLVEANAKLIATYKIGADEARNMVTWIANAATAAGRGAAEVDSLSRMMAKIAIQGKASGRDILSMTNMGINAYEMLARSTGRLASEFSEGKIEITFDMLKKAFEDSASAGGMFEGALKNAASGFRGLRAQIEKGSNNIWHAIGQVIEPAGKMIMRFIIRIQTAATKFFKTTLGKIVIWAGALGIATAAIGTITVGVLMLAKALIFTVIPSIKSTAVAIWGALAPLLPFIAIIAVVVAAIWGCWKALNSNNENWQKFGLILMVLLGPIGLIIGAIKAWGDSGKWIDEQTKSWEEYRKTLSPISEAFVKIGTILRAVVELFKYSDSEGMAMTKNMKDKLEEMGLLDFVEMIGEWVVRIKAFFEGLRAGLQPVIDFFKELWGSIKEAVKAVIDIFSPLGELFGMVNKDIGNTTPVENWINAGKTAAKVIQSALKPAMTTLKFMVEGVRILAVVLKAAMEYIIVPSIKMFMRTITDVWGAGEWLWDKLKGFLAWFISLPAIFIQTGKNILTGLWDGFKSIFPSIAQWIEGIITTIIDKFVSLPEKIKSGFKAAWNWITGGSAQQAQPQAVTSSGSVTSVPVDFSPSKIGETMATNVGQQWGPQGGDSVERVTDNRTEQVNITVQMDGDKVADAVIDKMNFKNARKN